MALDERDALTGYLTTGHEWNGIKELNTPVPRPVYAFLALAFAFSVVYWILMPAWPLGRTYTKGLLGTDQRQVVSFSLEQATLARAAWTKRIEAESFAAIQADPALMTTVRDTGHTLFGNNCAVCHGIGAKGNIGFPNLTTTSFLWGGSPEAIAETIRVGINSAHAETRTSQMPAFGRDQMLPRADIENVVAYVHSLSAPAPTAQAGSVEAGKKAFAANCAACHGEDAKGNTDLGTPNLADKFWIYGGGDDAIRTTVWGGRQGHMPTWESRLSAAERKILALYLVDLREPNQ